MMNLSERLAQRQGQTPQAHSEAPRPAVDVPRRAARNADPFAGVKRSVHQGLIETLGPKLYDAHLDQRELEQQVTQTLQAVLQRDDTPMTATDRARVAQEV